MDKYLKLSCCRHEKKIPDSELAESKFPYKDSPLAYVPEELEVQASFGQEELVVLLEPHLAHGRVLEEMSNSSYVLALPKAFD